jgi:hypothetical protein
MATTEELFDRIYGLATFALQNMPKDKTISAEAFVALDEIRLTCLETPTALRVGKYEVL